jgi:hypothetical protein
MVEIDREPGGSTMIRVSTEVREMIETAKIIPREPLNDCIKRVFTGYQKCQEKQFVADMERIDRTGKFVSLEEAKKELGIL